MYDLTAMHDLYVIIEYTQDVNEDLTAMHDHYDFNLVQTRRKCMTCQQRMISML